MPEGYPQEDSFIIGDVPARTLVAVLQLQRLRTALLGFVRNNGDSAFTLTAMSSLDNGVADAYAGVNMRWNGASVSSITVQPGGEVDFIIESPSEQYISFYASPQPGSIGELRIFSRYGHYTTRIDVGVP